MRMNCWVRTADRDDAAAREVDNVIGTSHDHGKTQRWLKLFLVSIQIDIRKKKRELIELGLLT